MSAIPSSSDSARVPGKDPNPANSRSFYILLAGITFTGLLLRIYQLGMDDLWTDEALTGFIALTDDWFSYLRIDNTPPLYNLIIRAWCGVSACNEFGLRLPSVISGCLFILITAFFVRELIDPRTSILVAALATLSPLHIYYSQEARVYAILTTVLMLFLYLQYRVSKKPSGNLDFILLFLTASAALYLHYLSIIIITAGFMILAVARISGNRDIPGRYFLSIILSLLIYVPWLFFSIFSDHTSSTELGWISVYINDKSIWQLPLRSIVTYLFGMQFHYQEINLFIKRPGFAETSVNLQYLNTLLAGIYFCGFAYCLRIIKRPTVKGRSHFIEVSMTVLLALAALVFLSLTVRPVYVVGRYDLIAFPAFILVSAYMIGYLLSDFNFASGLKHYGLYLIFFLIFCQQALIVFHYTSAEPYHGVEENVPEITRKINDNDALLIATPEAVEYWFYMHKLGYNRSGNTCWNDRKRFTCRLFPENLEQAPALLDRFHRLDMAQISAMELDYLLQDLDDSARVFLLVSNVMMVDGEYRFDPVAFALMSKFRLNGYRIEEIDIENKMITFKTGA